MLFVIFELRINWYTNKGQISSTVNEHNVVSLRYVAQRDNINSVHKMIFNNQSAAQRDGADYFVTLRTEKHWLNSFKGKMIRIFVKCMI